MRGHGSLLGAYLPGNSILHRAPLWLKAVMVTVLSCAVLIADNPGVTSFALVLLATLYLAGARLRLAQLWRTLAPLWPVLAVLGGYQWLVNGLPEALLLIGNIAACIIAARLITITTPGRELLDSLVTAARPLRTFGADPERFGLTLALMLRSIPYLVGSVTDVRDAAKARGLERNPRALVIPVIVGAVAYAHQTGDALAARGLGEAEGARTRTGLAHPEAAGAPEISGAAAGISRASRYRQRRHAPAADAAQARRRRLPAATGDPDKTQDGSA